MPATNADEEESFIPVLRPQLPPAERLIPYLRRIDQTRIYSNHGPLSLELEQRLAGLLCLPPSGIVCASCGTAALIGAILATAGRGTAVRPLALLPSFTFAATAAAIEQCGYIPYLADVDAENWMLDPGHLRRHPELDRVGVVVPVAPFGRPVPQHPWQVFRRQTGIPVVIDGAASFEAASDAPDRFLGALPVVLSFHATKSFATGEGGGVATTDLILAERIIRALNFGFLESRDCQSPSINGKMSEYHAAVGLAELDLWPEKRMALQTVSHHYRRKFKETGLSERFYGPPDIAGCYALFECLGVEEAVHVQRSLNLEGVDFRLWYGMGLHRQSYFAELPRDALPVTDDLAPRLLGLPVAPDLSEAAVQRVVDGLVRVIRANRPHAGRQPE